MINDYQSCALLCDDDDDSVDGGRISFESLGYRVWTARNGEDAVRVFEEATAAGIRFDFIVIDYMMPKMNGDVAISKIKELIDTKGSPVPRIILLTGSNDGNLPVRARAAGISEILLKPSGMVDLYERLKAQQQMAAA